MSSTHDLLPPDEFIDKKAHLVDAFCEIAIDYCLERTDAESLFRTLPLALKASPAFFSRLDKEWLYSYGLPIDRLPADQQVIGSTNFPRVKHLFRGILAVQKHLSNSELLGFLHRLEDPAKHHETLFELSPLIHAPSDVTARNEVVGLGEGNKSADWLFEYPDCTPILIEVKYRIADLVKHLEALVPGIVRGEEAIDERPADPTLLFRNVVEKFRPCSPSERLQGAWVHTNIKVNESQLREHFQSLDSTRIHFAVLADWDPDVTIIGLESGIEDKVLSFFHLTRTDRFVVS